MFMDLKNAHPLTHEYLKYNTLVHFLFSMIKSDIDEHKVTQDHGLSFCLGISKHGCAGNQ